MHVIGSRPSGGAERFYSRLVLALNEQGHRALAVNQPGSAVSQQIGRGAEQHQVRMRGVWDRLARFQLGRLAERREAAVVQTYMGRATRIFRRRSQGTAVHVARLGGFYDVAGYKHADALVGNSRGICDHLVRSGVPASSVHYIGNFVDPEPEIAAPARAVIRMSHGIRDDEWAVVFVGRLHKNKGLPDLLAAFDRMPTEVDGRRVNLVIVGDGPEHDTLKTQAGSLSSRQRIQFLGWVDNPADCYAMADLFVCPSVHEPLGNVVLEAWAHALPVVSTRSQGPSEYMHDGVDGWLTDVSDARQLAGAIEYALRLPAPERHAVGQAGLEQVRTNHSRARVTSEYLQLYADLTGH